MIESDEAYRDRILDQIPEGAWYTAEDLSDASGDALDALGKHFGVKRAGSTTVEDNGCTST